MDIQDGRQFPQGTLCHVIAYHAFPIHVQNLVCDLYITMTWVNL